MLVYSDQLLRTLFYSLLVWTERKKERKTERERDREREKGRERESECE
jgi:hypothetical protein